MHVDIGKYATKQANRVPTKVGITIPASQNCKFEEVLIEMMEVGKSSFKLIQTCLN
jgi:hypothetical protein